jgi:hypothetical protein
MPQRQNAGFRSDGHVIAKSNFVGSAIQQAAEVDNVPFSEMNPPRVEKSTVHLDRRPDSKTAKVNSEKRITNCAGGQFADDIIVKKAQE